MLQAKTKITLELPESVPLIESIAIPVSEPVRLPRPGRPWTIADLESLAGAENRYELVRGDLLMMTPSSPTHGRYASRLTTALSTYVDAHELGEVYTAEPGFVFKPEPDAVVRAPDVAFVRIVRSGSPAQWRRYTGRGDLIPGFRYSLNNLFKE